MGQALYRKYRSRSWDELIGQQHIATTLSNAVKTGSFSHAYLFSGPRGVGKTSAARLLARQINGLEYTSDEPHIDIIEIDAASNTSVEDIRDLREKVSVAPSLAKYKIYIIDEVHMLSKSAFNALLKTLEEPPAHVVFILATTDPQKLPETIISRTQHFVFRPITSDLAASHLREIAKTEKIKLNEDATMLIAELGEGSFRDSIGLLDQLAASGETISRELVEDLAGLPPEELITQLALLVENHDPRGVVELLARADSSGYQASAIAKRLGQLWRQEALEGASSRKLALVKELLPVAGSPKPEQLLEIILLEAALDGTAPAIATASETQNTGKKEISQAKNETKPKSASANEPTKPKVSSTGELWPSILEKLRSQHPTLYSMARMAKPDLSDKVLKLEFAHKFQYGRVSESKNCSIIAKIAKDIAGQPLEIKCEINPDSAASGSELTISAPTVDPPLTAPLGTEQDDDLKTINSIFGGSELLQS